MNIEKVKDIYKEIGIATTPILELKIKILHQCLALVAEGKYAIQETNLVRRNEVLKRCQELLIECLNLLNYDLEMSTHVIVVYEFAIQQLIVANIKGDILVLNEVELILMEVLKAWENALTDSRKNRNKGNLI